METVSVKKPVMEVVKSEPPTLIFQTDIGNNGQMLIADPDFETAMDTAFAMFNNKRVKVTVELAP